MCAVYRHYNYHYLTNPDSAEVDENRGPFVKQSSRGNRVLGFSTDLHYLGISTDLKAVSFHLLPSLSL